MTRPCRGDADLVVCTNGCTIGGAGAMCDPSTTALAHQRIERHRNSSRRGAARDSSALTEIMKIGFAIRHHRKRSQARIDLSGTHETRANKARRWAISARIESGRWWTRPGPVGTASAAGCGQLTRSGGRLRSPHQRRSGGSVQMQSVPSSLPIARRFPTGLQVSSCA